MNLIVDAIDRTLDGMALASPGKSLHDSSFISAEDLCAPLTEAAKANSMLQLQWMRAFSFEQKMNCPNLSPGSVVKLRHSALQSLVHTLALLPPSSCDARQTALSMSAWTENVRKRVMKQIVGHLMLLPELGDFSNEFWTTMDAALAFEIQRHLTLEQKAISQPPSAKSSAGHQRAQTAPKTTVPSSTLGEKMILNCFPGSAASVVDNSDTFTDDSILLDSMSDEVKRLVDNPVDFSIELMEMMISMVKVISTPPAGMRGFGLTDKNNTLGSISDIVSANRSHWWGGGRVFNNDATTAADLDRDSGSDSKYSQHSQMESEFIDYRLLDPILFKSIRRMPTFETFRKFLFALRFVNLQSHLINDEDRILFWVNVSNRCRLTCF